jgi:hypothetical protein
VLLDAWSFEPPPAERVLTSVANWRSYGTIVHEGVRYGQKAHSFRALLSLGARSPVPISIALAIDSGDERDRCALVRAGWRLADPVCAAGDTIRYRQFVQASWAELGVAKEGYVVGQTGWFSDRSACYLATGRPVVAQDTGLVDVLPTGRGLLTFRTTDEAIERVHELTTDYSKHAVEARGIAEQHLDARRVLADVIGWLAP